MNDVCHLRARCVPLRDLAHLFVAVGHLLRERELLRARAKILMSGGLQVAENRSSANTVLHYGKDGALAGPDREHAETSTLALHLLQSALVHVNTLLVRQVLAEPTWAKNPSDEDRRGLTALF
ncbi:Tn3 family transposase [Streptomyces sp. NPDC056656]|uniref:Tn3 family transposase n=1 Tax=Streptomyces sp. NPDC056656 TaxID=3345895 RepID=UPI0036A10FF6